MGINLDNVPEELRKKIRDLQNKQIQLQNFRNSHEYLESQNRDTELSIQELEKASSDTTVFKSIGGILVKSTRDRLLDEKKSLKVSIEMRLKTIKQKVDRSIQELEQIRKAIQSDLQNNQ